MNFLPVKNQESARFSLCLLAIVLSAWAAPVQAAEPAPHRLVNLAQLPDPPVLDIRYATRMNFTGQKLYPSPAAWLHEDAARALEGVQAELRERGLGLKVFDGYRPLRVQQMMWDLIRDERYVSNPAVNLGRHTRGTAVDVSLVDKMGDPLEMPTGYDDFSEKAHRNSEAASVEASANARLLEEVMTRHGFEPFPTEWWHYDWKGWKNYPVLDISMEELMAGEKVAVPAEP